MKMSERRNSQAWEWQEKNNEISAALVKQNLRTDMGFKKLSGKGNK